MPGSRQAGLEVTSAVVVYMFFYHDEIAGTRPLANHSSLSCCQGDSHCVAGAPDAMQQVLCLLVAPSSVTNDSVVF
jgi:hypothetical protein